MTDLREVIKNRHSIREFKKTDVSNETIGEIIKLASLAPSAGNLQSYRVVVSREQIVDINSPVQLAVCADLTPNRYGRQAEWYAIQNAKILAAYIQLVAVDMGLATVWVGAFKEGKVRNLLGLPDYLKPIAIIPIGYSDVVKGRGRRKSLEQIIWQKSQ